MININTTVSRRDFVRVSLVVGGGLMVSVYGCGPNGEPAAEPRSDGSLAPNAFVRIDTNGNVIVTSKHLEMGQGAYTGLATLIAEELDADWSKVTVEGAGADKKKFGNLNMGGVQGTGGSSTIANSFDQHRKAGATARAMLVVWLAGDCGGRDAGADQRAAQGSEGVSLHRQGEDHAAR
jgi:isoquinoline 1-oxidoreductase subunit beta